MQVWSRVSSPVSAVSLILLASYKDRGPTHDPGPAPPPSQVGGLGERERVARLMIGDVTTPGLPAGFAPATVMDPSRSPRPRRLGGCRMMRTAAAVGFVLRVSSSKAVKAGKAGGGGW